MLLALAAPNSQVPLIPIPGRKGIARERAPTDEAPPGEGTA